MTPARCLIAERGFAGLRTRDIAERLAINIATLHYHVPGKERLIELVAQSLRDEFAAQAACRPRQDLSGAERLRQEFRDIRQAMAEEPERLVVMRELIERARRDETIRAVVEPMQLHWLSRIEAMLARLPPPAARRNRRVRRRGRADPPGAARPAAPRRRPAAKPMSTPMTAPAAATPPSP